MIQLPDFERAFDFENDFYLSCDITRMSKMLAHYELFKMALDVPGAIIECGVFKGASFSRFAMFRELLSMPYAKKLIGFDTFGRFPDTQYQEDEPFRSNFVKAAGEESISVTQLEEVLNRKQVNRNIGLVEGNIVNTVPEYVKKNPEMRISLLNLDTDVYEPAVVILESLYPLIVSGGILAIDDYGVFPGETRAVEEYFRNKDVKIKKFPFAMSPCYIVKP